MNAQLYNLLVQVLVVATPILLAALLAWLHTVLTPYLADKGHAAWALLCVQYAEQWLEDKTGPAKFTEAASRFTARYPSVPQEKVKTLIEASVAQLRAGLPGLVATATPLATEMLQGYLPAVQKVEITHVIASPPATAPVKDAATAGILQGAPIRATVFPGSGSAPS